MSSVMELEEILISKSIDELKNMESEDASKRHMAFKCVGDIIPWTLRLLEINHSLSYVPDHGGKKVMYLCDGRVKECPKTNCFLTGGSCNKTSRIENAVNFQNKNNGGYTEIERAASTRETEREWNEFKEKNLTEKST